MRRFLILNVVLLLLVSCSGKRATTSYSLQRDSLSYAKGFRVDRCDDFIAIEVVNPWDTSLVLQRYILLDSTVKSLPSNLPNGSIIKTPIKNVAVYASVHASILELLNSINSVSGVCEVDYLDSKTIKELVAQDKIANLGESYTPNIEKIIDSGTEYIISSPFKDMGYSGADKLGIPIIEGVDYMENTPLGRAEWIKFFGLLVGKEELANEIFINTENEYNSVKDSLNNYIANNGISKPTLLAEMLYGAHWFVPCGDSYMATMYNDAGANYIFNNLEGSGSVALSFEQVFDEAIHADYWFVKYNAPKNINYSSLMNSYRLYSKFDAFKNKNVYGCNTGIVPYYAELPIFPQYALMDMINIFYPGFLNNYSNRYFIPL